MFDRVLVPTDFSKDSRKVLECISDVPGIKGAVLFHVARGWAIARLWGDPVAEGQ